MNEATAGDGTPRILDSRRLTGPSLLLDEPGAILDVTVGSSSGEALARTWAARLRELLAALGWPEPRIGIRHHAGGASLAFAAPIDALYAATEVQEWAFAAATHAAGDSTGESIEDACVRLREAIARERRPALVALAQAAEARGLTFLSDSKRASIGLGTGSRSWPLARIPATPERVRWNGLHDVPVALVTGTNGKTTVARLVGAIAAAAGRVAGVTSTDRVDVGAETVAVGDYSGPNGARTVLRDRRVELAVLEVARGGILRRGLPLPRVRAALVTNVANDHLGEYGIHDLEALADAKLVVAKAVEREGHLVLNADDPRLLARGRALDVPITWFTLEAGHADVASHVARGGHACVLEEGTLVLHRGSEHQTIARVDELPIAFGGAARHNVANALAAIGVASALDLPHASIARGLAGFESSPTTNPGRANLWEVNGARVVVDFAHNPHGLAAMIATLRDLEARRRAIVIGQAGDRDDASIAELARAAAELRPDRVFIKEMEKYFRGRERGVVTEIIAQELRRAGIPEEALSRHDTELDAARAALEWMKPGDLLLLTVHVDRDAIAGLLEAKMRGEKARD